MVHSIDSPHSLLNYISTLTVTVEIIACWQLIQFSYLHYKSHVEIMNNNIIKAM